jgi:hypothetical protein
MEKASLGGKTFLEEEREREKEKDVGVKNEGERRRWALEGTRDVFGKTMRRFGHLREVGVDGFVSAVEEERGVWVVVHLYEPVSLLFLPSFLSLV